MTDRTVAQGGLDTQSAKDGVPDSISPSGQVADTLQPIVDTMAVWRGDWDPLGQYLANDQSIANGWLVVANKATTDNPVPSPVGEKAYIYPDTPVFDTQSNPSVVVSGQVYTLLKDGKISRARCTVPQVSADITSRVKLGILVDGEIEEFEEIFQPVLSPGQWSTVAAGNRIFLAGTKFVVVIDELNSGTSTSWARNLNFLGVDNTLSPVVGGWNRNNQSTVLRINKTDADAGDISVELGDLDAGSEILFTDQGDVTSFDQYRVNSQNDAGDHFTYNVTLIGRGTALNTNDLCTADADIPVASSTQYSETLNYWPANSPAWADVEGYLTFNGVKQVGSETSGYGVDIEFQEYLTSPDWDIQSSFGTITGTNAASGRDFDKVKRVTEAYDIEAADVEVDHFPSSNLQIVKMPDPATINTPNWSVIYRNQTNQPWTTELQDNLGATIISAVDPTNSFKLFFNDEGVVAWEAMHIQGDPVLPLDIDDNAQYGDFFSVFWDTAPDKTYALFAGPGQISNFDPSVTLNGASSFVFIITKKSRAGATIADGLFELSVNIASTDSDFSNVGVKTSLSGFDASNAEVLGWKRTADYVVAQANWLNVWAGDAAQALLTTTDGVWTTINTTTLADQEIVRANIRVVATETIGNAIAQFDLSLVASGSGAVATTDYNVTGKEGVGADGLRVRVIAIGDTAALQVKGITGESWDWTATLDSGGNV